MNESMGDGRGKTLPTLIPEILAIAFEKQRKTESEMEGGREKTKAKVDAYNGEIAEKVAMCETADDGNTEYSCPLILETSAVVFENQCETGEMGGGGKKGKVGSRFGWNSDPDGIQFRKKADPKGGRLGQNRSTESNSVEHEYGWKPT